VVTAGAGTDGRGDDGLTSHPGCGLTATPSVASLQSPTALL